MLDIKFIRETPDLGAPRCCDKRIKIDLDRVLELDRQIKPLQVQWEDLQARAQRAVEGDRDQAASRARGAQGEVQAIKAKMEEAEKGLEGLRK